MNSERSRDETPWTLLAQFTGRPLATGSSYPSCAACHSCLGVGLFPEPLRHFKAPMFGFNGPPTVIVFFPELRGMKSGFVAANGF